MIHAYVGAGGKTTTMLADAKRAAGAGKKIVVCTTTHMFWEPGAFEWKLEEDFDLQMAALNSRLEKEDFVLAGIKGKNGKMDPLPAEVFEVLEKSGTELFIEADGSKRLPLKFPDPKREPCFELDGMKIVPDEIFVLAGAASLGQRVEETVHRYEMACEKYGWKKADSVSMNTLLTLLVQEYLIPLNNEFPAALIQTVITGLPESAKQRVQDVLHEQTPFASVRFPDLLPTQTP